jgi:ParB family chromosome partitioning protein
VPDAAAASARPAGGRGIGRGLAAILPHATREEDGLRHIATELIKPNELQPRRGFDGESLMALSESIKARGVLQPIVVRPLRGGTYELIAGERRLRAAKLAKLDRIPAIVREAEDSERLELALIENMAREDLNPVEEARACATLVEDLGVTKEELARRLGRNRVTLSNLIRLLSLPDDVLGLLESGELTEGHGRALLLCKDHDARRRLARTAIGAGWSVRETERRARKEETGSAAPRDRPVVLHPDLADALAAGEDALAAALGREVRMRPRGAGYRVEFDVEDPAEALALAERLSRRNPA